MMERQKVKVWCDGAHFYDWETYNPNARPPRFCKEHVRYSIQPVRKRLKTPERVLLEWTMASQALDDPLYVDRWQSKWNDACRRLAAIFLSWGKVPMDKIDSYIRAARLAEYHRLVATEQPYVVSNTGAVKPHPGWQLAEQEEARAKKIRKELGLILGPEDLEDEIEFAVAPRSSQPHKTALQEDAESHEQVVDFVGADGEAL